MFSLTAQNPAAYANSIFLASIKEKWSETSKLPWGHNVRFVGEAGAIHAETQALLVQNGVDHGDFPRTVIRELREFLPENDHRGVDVGANVRGSRWTIPDEEIAKRRDLRNQRIFTIDPTGAKDLDDALSVTVLSDGTIEMGVHIADVTYFVRPNTNLDREARRRATTVYLVQQAIPMLPPLLCEELCSLNPLVDRLTYSCIWRMHPDGTLADEPAWFGRTVIRSCCKLDYQTAQNMIEGFIRPEDASSAPPQLWDPNRSSENVEIIPKVFYIESIFIPTGGGLDLTPILINEWVFLFLILFLPQTTHAVHLRGSLQGRPSHELVGERAEGETVRERSAFPQHAQIDVQARRQRQPGRVCVLPDQRQQQARGGDRLFLFPTEHTLS